MNVFTSKNGVRFSYEEGFRGNLIIDSDFTDSHGDTHYETVRVECQDVFDFIGHVIDVIYLNAKNRTVDKHNCG